MTSTFDIMVVVAMIIFAVILALVVVHLFMERKKITHVTLNNADDDIYPALTIATVNTATVADQTFDTTLGKVFVSQSVTNIDADTKSALIVQVLDGPATFAAANGAAVTLKFINKTDKPIHVNGGRISNDFNAGVTDFVRATPLHGSIKAVTAPANDSITTPFLVSGAAFGSIGTVAPQIGISVVAQA